jgi:hypothetical protein
MVLPSFFYFILFYFIIIIFFWRTLEISETDRGTCQIQNDLLFRIYDYLVELFPSSKKRKKKRGKKEETRIQKGRNKMEAGDGDDNRKR